MNQTLEDFPLNNFNLVVYDHSLKDYKIINSRTHPHSNMVQLVVSAMLPRNLGPLKMFSPAIGMNFSSIDFAPAKTRKDFFSYLSKIHPSCNFCHFNMSRTGTKGNVHYQKICSDRFPTFYKIFDAAKSFLHLPNERYKKAYLCGASDH